MSDEDVMTEFAKNAIITTIGSATVCLVDELSEPSRPLRGSGTLIRSADKLFILTAAHVLEDAAGFDTPLENMRIFTRVGTYPAAEVVAARPRKHPNALPDAMDVDVAILEIKSGAMNEVRQNALEIDRVVAEPPDLQKLDLAVCGFPSERVMSSPALGNLMSWVTRFVNFREVKRNEDRLNRWLVPWGEYTNDRRFALSPIVDSDVMAEMVRRFGADGQVIQEPLDPHGISGGGAWIVYGDDPGPGLWDAGKHLWLSGVEVAKIGDDVVIVDPAHRWFSWFCEQCAS